jgi:hypothetical protein
MEKYILEKQVYDEVTWMELVQDIRVSSNDGHL